MQTRRAATTGARELNGIELIANVLKHEGIEWIACFPSNPLIEAVAKEGIRPIAFRLERGAVYRGRIQPRERPKTYRCGRRPILVGAENALGGTRKHTPTTRLSWCYWAVTSLTAWCAPNYVAFEHYAGLCRRAEALYTSDQILDVMRRAFRPCEAGLVAL